jgi:hypothetical protein
MNGTAAGCAALLVLYAAIAYSAALTKSPTFDETLHATAGHVIRWSADYRVDVEDPALFPLLATLPQAQSDLKIDTSDPQFQAIAHDHPQQFAFCVRTVYQTPRTDLAPGPSGPPLYAGAAYVNRARAVFTAVAVLLGALLAWWAYRLAGSAAAISASLLFSLDPNFIAHGPLVKNDVLITLLMLLLLCAISFAGQRATWRSLAAIVFACAIAVNVKFSSLIFAPILAIAVFVRSILPWSWNVAGKELTTRAARLLFSAAFCVVVALIAWGAIWCVYRFRASMAPDQFVTFERRPLLHDIAGREIAAADPQHRVPTDAQADSHPLSAKVRALLWMDDHHLLPTAWLFGLLDTYRMSLYRSSFLLGEYSGTGWWYYFPLAMLFKTPMAALVGIFVLAALCLARFRFSKQDLPQSWTMFCLWLPIVIYGASAMRTNLNIGVRHVLPLYPFIYLLMAMAIARVLKISTRAARIALAVLACGLAIESLRCWPDYIPFFNVACGGSRGGIRLLGDSNLDWGQDLPLLAKWQESHPNVPLYLNYFGTADPQYYGIDYLQTGGGYLFGGRQPVPMKLPGVFAISASNLQGIQYTPETRRRYLDYWQRKMPIAVLGGSIYLYEFNPRDYDARDSPAGRP